MASIAGKNRDQGSIFSQETRQRGYWRPRKQKVFYYLPKMIDRCLFVLTE